MPLLKYVHVFMLPHIFVDGETLFYVNMLRFSLRFKHIFLELNRDHNCQIQDEAKL